MTFAEIIKLECAEDQREVRALACLNFANYLREHYGLSEVEAVKQAEDILGVDATPSQAKASMDLSSPGTLTTNVRSGEMEGNPVPTNVAVASYALRWYRNRIKEMCDDAARRRPYEMLFVLRYRDGLGAVEARKQVEEMFGAGCLSGIISP